MPIYDHECQQCGKIFEAISPYFLETIQCDCGGLAKRIISCGRVYTANEDASWLKTVPEVINKDTTNPIAKEFIKNPTRQNYKAWMKSEGLRPLENNEPTKPKPTDLNPIRKEVWRKHQRRHRIEI